MGNTEGQKTKIDEEAATADFERFAEAWDLDTAVDRMNAEDSEDFTNHRWRIIRQIIAGRALVNEDGNIVYTLFKPFTSITEVTITLPDTRAFTSMDKEKVGRSMGQSVQFIAEAIGQVPGIVKTMGGIDFKFLQVVYGLFLGS